MFSKGKPHIKKAAPVGGEQIKGEQQGNNQWLIFGKLLWQPDKILGGNPMMDWHPIQGGPCNVMSQKLSTGEASSQTD